MTSQNSSQKFISRPIPFVGLLVLVLIIGGLIGWSGAFGDPPHNRGHETRQSNLSQNSYKFIDPLLMCESSPESGQMVFAKLRHQIQDLIDQRVSKGDLSVASVYFDTRNGQWLGLNIGEQFSPASLFKVPIMIAYLKAAQENPDLLERKLTYTGEEDSNAVEYFKPKVTLEANKSYTTNELLERLIGYSDNNALDLLLKNMPTAYFFKVFTELGIQLPTKDSLTLVDFISVKTYANLFRILYNATYLNREMSERALALLTDPDFPQGIQAGVPPDVVVANKFGERAFAIGDTNPTDLKVLHDCAVVYHPAQPYLVCIMTKGHDFEKLRQVIQDISKLAYDYVDNGAKNLTQNGN